MKKSINTMFSIRLKLLRTEAGLSQKQFAEKLGLFMGRENKLSLSSVSSWEMGKKLPNVKVVNDIAKFFNVTTEFLTGETNIREKRGIESYLLQLDKYTIQISQQNLEEYDGKPVYLVFNDQREPNCWGIYDKDKDLFYCKNQMYRNNGGMRFFAIDINTDILYRKEEEKFLELENLKNLQYFWVEYYGSNRFINAEFSGWYKHTETKNGIINERGNVLPYEGMNRYYHCYRKKY